MTAGGPFILFSRADCHLCDLAATMMQSADVAWRTVDIDGNPELVEKYGVHVPVVLDPGSGRELFFPFDDKRLLQFTQGNDHG